MLCCVLVSAFECLFFVCLDVHRRWEIGRNLTFLTLLSHPPLTYGDQSEEDEYIIIAMVKKLLKVQESMFQSLFESVANSLQTRLDDVVRPVQEIKTSLEFTQKNVKELETLHSSIAKTNEDVKRLNADLSSHSLSLEYLENQSRRNNIRVNGILESPRET